MTIVEATKTCFQKYFVFSGRAGRPEFWKFVLFLLLGSLVCTILNSVLFGGTVEDVLRISVDSDGNQTQTTSRRVQYNGGWIGTVFSLICLIPFLAAGWRRMHDTGRPGWLMLVLPVLGILISFAIIFATSQEVPIDLSSLPEGTELQSTMRIPHSGVAFIIGWLIGVSSIVITIVLLARKTNPNSNKYGEISSN
jgi:uncharacterized membrane protein YhaH (DUF805 family)